MFYDILPSPIGDLLLVASDQGLTRLDMEPHSVDPTWRRDAVRLASARRQLEEYFAGERSRFDLPLALHGTEFQRRVWAALCDIPFAETASYGAVAKAVGRPQAQRAVGAANGRNPVGIIVPCHRVIGASGALVGYGGGMSRKRWLLEHERGVATLSQATGGFERAVSYGAASARSIDCSSSRTIRSSSL